jgi:hypothetical protein
VGSARSLTLDSPSVSRIVTRVGATSDRHPLLRVLLAFFLSLSWCSAAASADLQDLLVRARTLPPLADTTREAVERMDQSWRGELVSVVVQDTSEEHVAEATDLAKALHRARPAPMSLPSEARSGTSSTCSESLVRHEVGDRTRDTEPERPEVYRILSVFADGNEEFCFLCEATRIGPNELLTAGHCLYHHDPNGDGEQRDARWATRVWFWSVRTGPSNALQARRLAVHAHWVTRRALDHDVGLVTLPQLSARPGTEEWPPKH